MGLIDFILHIDQHLLQFINDYNNWVYLLLFMIIFVETGVVVMPFLPGDSLLFAVGMFSAMADVNLNIYVSIILLFIAAVLGDGCNYMIGKYLGERMLKMKIFGKQAIKPEHIEKTNAFYEKHGPSTIIIARFVPIVRTLAPFVAGIGKMSYPKFITYNIIGGFVWVVGITLAGYFLGQIPWIANNFEKVVFAIIGISVLPIIFNVIKAKLQKDK